MHFGERSLAEEVPVAIAYDGGTYAVLMSTPSDLEDFALGFSCTEGIIAAGGETTELSTEEAIHEASRMGFWPILMTRMCALLGGVPPMLGTGVGSEIRQPLGYAIVGGLLVSQLLTVFTTPVIYIYMDPLGQLFGRRRAAPVKADAPAR